MKVCRDCNDELIIGKNAYPSIFKNKDYKCKSCRKKHSRKYYYTPKGKEVSLQAQKKYNKKTYNKEISYKQNQHWRKQITGVYGIFENGRCLYIGESSETNNRISRHKTNIKNPEHGKSHTMLYYNLQQHNHLIFGVIEECSNHKEREKYFINMYKPIYNV